MLMQITKHCGTKDLAKPLLELKVVDTSLSGQIGQGWRIDQIVELNLFGMVNALNVVGF